MLIKIYGNIPTERIFEALTMFLKENKMNISSCFNKIYSFCLFVKKIAKFGVYEIIHMLSYKDNGTRLLIFDRIRDLNGPTK